MKGANSLSRQIILSMSAVVLCVITLAIVGTYVFMGCCGRLLR